jgi:CRP/FNR family transcriptional regulator
MATPIDLDILSELRQIAAFNDVGKEALAELALACTQRRVHAGQSLVDQGVPSQSLIILVRGAAKLARTMNGCPGDESVVIDVMRAPCILADSAVIDGGAAFASVVTLRASHVIAIDRRVLVRLMTTHPALARVLLSRFAQEVRERVRRIDEIVTGPVDERVINLLDSLALAHGTLLGQGRFIAIPLRRRDLANMVNATTETVSRLLAKFERDGQARSTRDGIWWRTPPATAVPASTRRLTQSGMSAAVSAPQAAPLAGVGGLRQGNVG